MKKLFLISLSAAFFTACQQPSGAESVETTTDTTEVAEPALNVDSIAQALEQKRENLEQTYESLTRKELATDSLRPQIRQKWSTIHFYYQGDKLVRIKTYPHEGVSLRTEEFYFDGDLFAAVIEDKGAGEEGPEQGEEDKVYYFHVGELIKEVNNTKEEEFSIRESDAERLLQEAREYQELASGV